MGPAPFDDIGDIPYHDGAAGHKEPRTPEVRPQHLPVWAPSTPSAGLPPIHPSLHSASAAGSQVDGTGSSSSSRTPSRSTPTRQSGADLGGRVSQPGDLRVCRGNLTRGAAWDCRENLNNHRNNMINDRSQSHRDSAHGDAHHSVALGDSRDDLNNSGGGISGEQNHCDNFRDNVDHVGDLPNNFKCCDNFRRDDCVDDLRNDFYCRRENVRNNVDDVSGLRSKFSCTDINRGDGLCNNFSFGGNSVRGDDFADDDEDKSSSAGYSPGEEKTSPSLLCKMASCVQPMCPNKSPEFYSLDTLPQFPPFGPPKHAWEESAESSVQ